jgi:uncharacterized membrane protein YphA (DoxX/SURF4 family)
LNAHFIAILECVGGILLILGLASRLIALPLLIDMIMAYVIADVKRWDQFSPIQENFITRRLSRFANFSAHTGFWPWQIFPGYLDRCEAP